MTANDGKLKVEVPSALKKYDPGPLVDLQVNEKIGCRLAKFWKLAAVALLTLLAGLFQNAMWCFLSSATCWNEAVESFDRLGASARHFVGF